MSVSFARASRIASSCPKDFDFLFFVYQNEGDYTMWISPRRIINGIYALPESMFWNALLCVLTMINIVCKSMNFESEMEIVTNFKVSYCFDILFNILFFLDIIGRLMNDHYEKVHEKGALNKWHIMWYILDVISYGHYIALFLRVDNDIYVATALGCYYERMHRPIGFLWSLLDYHLKGHILFSLMKYFYLFTVLKIFASNIIIWGIYKVENWNTTEIYYTDPPKFLASPHSQLFYRSFNTVLQLFCGIGPDGDPIHDDFLRIWQMCVLGTSLLVMGTGVAALAIIMSIHMRPEESFRARFRLIMNEMKTTNVPRALRKKVDTFYRMYWEKQKAVSVTWLLPTYPPSLISTIRTDMYFEAQQKSRVLRDLSYQFLKEIAKRMVTINYVPGDTIVKRNSHKSAMIYIAYGDVEMLTAEDDETPILRFSRGTIINPCGPSVVVSSTIAHVGVRAATFCTAHVLNVTDLWRVAAKFGKHNGQNFILNSSFMEHLEKVKTHYGNRTHLKSKYKSTILLLKRNLIELKEARDDKNELLLSRTNVFLELAGCYIMRNRKGTSFTEQSDVICLRSTYPCILQPMSSLQIAWQLFISMVALCVGIGYPYYYVYTNKIIGTLEFLDYVISFIFVLDIVAYLSTGAKIEEGVPITFTHTSMRQVHDIWFIVDLISVVPIFEFIGNGYYGGINKLFKLLKVFRMLKRFEEVWVNQANALRFASYFILFSLICYMIASVAQAVLCDAQQFCEITNLGKEPWEKYVNSTDENIETRLVYGLYWSISMITRTCNKSNTFTPKYWDVTTLTMCLILFSQNFHFAALAAYSATIMVSEAMNVKYVSCIDTVKDFLSKNNVNVVLMQRFISYLQLCWYTDKAYSINHGKSSILFDLPPHVHQDIMAMQRSKYLLCIPFMKCVHRAELKVISARARLFYTSPNEILLNTGDISNEIYVIKQGFCEILDPISKGVVSLITAKSYFGDLECLLRLPAFYTVRAVTHVQVFSISRKHLLKALAEPKIAESIQYAKEQPEYMLLTKRQDQFISFEPLPPPPNRELFPLPRKHEPDVAFLLPFNRLGFLSILRYVFPRYTIRPDGKYMKRYERFRALCAFISAIIFPVYQTLELQWHVFWHITSILDFTAVFDIIQRMLVGYFDERGILVYHPASTATYYIKGAFLVDLIGCLPLESLDSIRTQVNTVPDGYRVLNTLQFLMFNRLLQLYRVPHVIDDLNRIIKRPDIVYILKIIPFLMAMLMVMASLIISWTVSQIKLWNGGWRLEEHNDFVVWTNISAEYMSYKIIEDPWSLLITSVFWVTYEITTTGYNLFLPNLAQLYILVIGMLFGTIMTMYFTVRVISIRANVHESLAEFQENMRDIKTFMKKEKLDKDLQKEVILYYEYMWEKTGGTNYRTVLKMCDQITLRTDAILHIYGQTFSKCPIMKNCEQSLLRLVGRAVRSTYVKQDMIIIEQGQVLTDLYFLDYGTVEVRREEDEDMLLTKLPRGSMFGNLDNKASTLCSNRFVASSNMHLLEINSVIFYSIIQDFPTVQLRLKKYRPHNENYIIGSVAGGQVMSIWKEHAVSSPKIVITREGFLKYLHEHNKALQLYLTIVSLLCVYGDIYNAGFKYNQSILIGILYTLDFLFVVKIVVKYATMFATDESESRNVLKTSGKKYYKGEFIYDILSVLPIELFCFINKENPWDIFAVLRLNRVFRMVTVMNCLREYRNKLSTNRLLTSLFMVMTWVSLMLHSAACFWNYVSIVGKGEQSWRLLSNGSSHCTDEYVCSFYFIITTFSRNSYNGIIPVTRLEVILVTFFMIVTTMIHMVYMGEIANILLYQYYRCYSFYAKYLEMHKFLKNNRVSTNLVNLTEKYTLFLWREARGLQIPSFITVAPQCLKQSIMAAAYMKHLKKHPVFMQCEPGFLRHVVGCLQPLYYDRNMYVAREGDITNAMYFIHKGKVQKLDEDMEHKIQVFRTGQNFGSFQGLNRDSPFTYSYRTIIKSQVLTLCLNDWESVLDHFPISKSIIYSDKSGDYEQHIPDPDEKKKEEKKDENGNKNMSKKKRLQSLIQGVTSSKVFKGGDAKPPPYTGKLTDIKPIVSEQSFSPPPPVHSTYNPPSALAHQSYQDRTEEGDFPRPPQSARRKSVNILDKAAVNEELQRIGSAPTLPAAQETSQPSSSAQPNATTTPKWPLNSRRRSSEDFPVLLPEKKQDDNKPKPNYGRRKSTLFADQLPAAAPVWPSGRSDDDLPVKNLEPAPTTVPAPTTEPGPTTVPGPITEPGPTTVPAPTTEQQPATVPEPTTEPAPTTERAPTAVSETTTTPALTTEPASTPPTGASTVLNEDKAAVNQELKDLTPRSPSKEDNPNLPPKPPGPTISPAFIPVSAPIPKLGPLLKMASSLPLVSSNARSLAVSGTSQNVPADDSSIFIPTTVESKKEDAFFRFTDRSLSREMQQGYKPKLEKHSQVKATHLPQGPVIVTSESTQSFLEPVKRPSLTVSRTSSLTEDTIAGPSYGDTRPPEHGTTKKPTVKPKYLPSIIPTPGPTGYVTTSIDALLPARSPTITILSTPSQQSSKEVPTKTFSSFSSSSQDELHLKHSETIIPSLKPTTSNISPVRSFLPATLSTTPEISTEIDEKTESSAKETSTEMRSDSTTTYDVLNPSDESVEAVYFNKRSTTKEGSDTTFIIPQGRSVSQTTLPLTSRKMATTNIYEINEKPATKRARNLPTEEIEMQEVSYTDESSGTTHLRLQSEHIERTLLKPPDERDFYFPAHSSSSRKSVRILEPEKSVVLEASLEDEKKGEPFKSKAKKKQKKDVSPKPKIEKKQDDKSNRKSGK